MIDKKTATVYREIQFKYENYDFLQTSKNII